MTKLEETFYHFNNVTICKLFSKVTGQTFYGEAKCSPEDEDNFSERKGEEIAARRAEIALLRYCRESLKEQMASFKHLICCMEQAKDFNHKDRNYRLTKRSYYDIKEIYTCIREDIAEAQKELKAYTGRV